MPYKVLGKEGKKLISTVAMGKSKVIYKTNKWVQSPEWLKVKGYHLTYFGKLKDALRFAKIESDAKGIYYCRVQCKIKLLPQLKDLWKLKVGIIGKIFRGATLDWAYGTKMAKKIMITKKVKI